MSHYYEANPIMGAVANEVEGAGGGKTYPGAVVPFGMVQLSPDTVTGGDNGAGYSYGHKTIEGFSYVHMSGIGWYGEFGNIQTMPIKGGRRYFSGTNEYAIDKIGSEGWESHYDKESETAHPGYYSCLLTDYNIKAECTASRHTGSLRFTFNDGGESHIAVDLYRRIGGHSNEQSVEISDDHTIKGRILCTPAGGGWGHGDGHAHYEIHFISVFSKPFASFALFEHGRVHENLTSMTGDNLGFIADYNLSAGEKVEITTSISFVDYAGAENNFRCEACGFDEMLEKAKKEWETTLDTIQVEGGTATDREIFYSSLYHTSLDPRDFSDCDGRYRTAMREPKMAQDYVCRTVFSGWDVYRSCFPLFSLIRPDIVSDEINTLMSISRQNGNAKFARWEIVGIESGCMVGDPGANILGDAAVKGIKGFDTEAAYQICRENYLGDKQNEWEIGEFNRQGYFTNDVSRTLEYCLTCYCLGRTAEKLGHAEDAKAFFEKSANWKNIFDDNAGWMNCRNAEGEFRKFRSKYDESGCVESNIYQQTWFVPHDILALYDRMGAGRFEKELEELFSKADLSAFWNDDYNHSNEPVHTIPQIFNYIGLPSRSQYWIRRIQKEAYRTGAYGYCGNEDVGQLSAWYILTAMGLHESTMASDIYELNTPLFTKAEIKLDRKNHSCAVSDTLIIKTDCDPQENGYIAGVSLNGTPLDRTYLTWSELTAGGEVLFSLTDKPTEFGKDNPPRTEY